MFRIALEFAAATDIGNVRGNNEDSFGYDSDQNLYVVCDGMGGMAAGEVASSMAVRALIESFAASAAADVSAPVEERLQTALREANRQVHQAGLEDPRLHAMGTTLVCVCFEGNRVLVGNVGDSRAYLVRGGECIQISQDHSFLEEQVRSGAMTPEIAAASNLNSVITRAIGADKQVQPDLFDGAAEPGDVLLLASDGFTRYATPELISRIVAEEADTQAACRRVIQHAKDSGGIDNITCLLIRVTAIESMTAEADGLAPPRII